MFPTYTSLSILETAFHVRFDSIQFDIIRLEITTRLVLLLGEVAQHQCLTVHKSLQKTTLTLQCTIHNLPFCECVQYVLVWLIESGSLQEKETRIRVSLVQESQHSLFERVVR